MRIKTRQFGGQFDPGQSQFVLVWPLHAEYRINDRTGKIEGEGYEGRSYAPLEEPDLFLSFVRLGAHGEPSQASILRWVEEYGLLERRGDDRHGVDQRPMSVDAVREHVRCARGLASLYVDIRERNSRAIWARFVGEGDYGDAQYHRNEVDNRFAPKDPKERRKLALAEFWLEERRLLEPPEDPIHLKSGVAAFEDIWESLIYGVTLQPLSDRFSVNDEGTIHLHSWEPHEPYKPVLSWRCPDLRSAIYLQFALMVTGGKPWRNCANPNCRAPFPARGANHVFCKAGCRSTGRNYPH